MTALVVTVLAASLLGSLHCAGMCGAFVAMCAAGDAPRDRARAQACYHLGRLAAYVTLGALAGALGAALDLSGTAFGLQRAAMALAGAGLVAFGLAALLRHLGLPVARLPAPAPLRRVAHAAHGIALRLPPTRAALALGLCSALLPCGWLYAFVLAAAGTGRADLGAVAMAAFWLGTVPVLVGVGAAVTALAGPLKRHAPLLASLAIVIAGLAALMGRLRVPALDAHAAVPAAHAAHAADVDPAAGAIEAVEAIDQETLPCCQAASPTE